MVRFNKQGDSSRMRDRRGSSGGRAGLPRFGGSRGSGSSTGGLRLPAKFSIPLLLIVGAVYLFNGGSIGDLLGGGASNGLTGQGSSNGDGTQTECLAPDDPEYGTYDLVCAAFTDIQDYWTTQFQAGDKPYLYSDFVVFTGGTSTEGCGFGQSAVGPFYCPADQNVYIDLTFFDELSAKFGAPGDFAQVYVVAHEVGHHVQNITGTSAAVRQRQAGMSQADANDLSVRIELQADCYAGAWASSLEDANDVTLEAGDIEEALAAAEAIGDDTLQRRGGGQVSPESWTHGSSEQRQRWFTNGLRGGPDACDTFGASRL